MPDPRDWEIVEAIACDGVGLEDFAEADIQRVTEQIMITEEQYAQLVADGMIKPEDLEAEKTRNQAETDRICALATQIVYQFSNGKRQTASGVARAWWLSMACSRPSSLCWTISTTIWTTALSVFPSRAGIVLRS